MTTIINSLQSNNVGIQVYNTEISAGATAPGRGAAIYHTNGNIYCVYGQTYNNGENRSLYFSVSTDQGFTWAAPTQLTTGNWDDDPALIQNDTTSTSSAINVAFTRILPGTPTLYVYVATLSLAGSLSNISPVNNGGSGFMTDVRFLTLNQITTNQFLVAGMNMGVNGGYPVMWSNNSSSFTAPSWGAYSTAMANLRTAIGSNFPVSFKLRKIASGNYIAIFAGYTTSNADNPLTVGSVAAPQLVLKTDLYYCSSTDGAGITWNSAVNITSYAGTPQFDMVSFPQALDADVVQLNDGSLTVIFAEGYGPQYFDSANEAGNITSPSLNYLINNPSALGMNRPCNNLLMGGGTNGAGYTGTGFFTYNTVTQGTYRFAAGVGANGQQIGQNHITNIAVSADGNYIAITTTATYPALGTLEVFYTGGSGDPSTWVLNGNTNLSIVGTIPLPAGRVPSNIVFQDNAFLLVGWVASGTTDVAFSRIDCSNLGLGFTDITMSVNIQSVDAYYGAMQYRSATSRLYFTSGGTFVSANVITGSAYDVSVSTPDVSLCYDDVNNQWLLNYASSSQITVVTDTGSSLSTSVITNTVLIGTDAHAFQAVSIPGGGMLFYYRATTVDTGMGSEQVGYGYYAFGTKTWYSAFEGVTDYTYQRPWGDATGINGIIPTVQLLYTGGWVLFVTHINGYNLKAVNVTNTGRLRIGNGTYTSGVLAISTFYDAVNQFNLGIQGTAVLFPNLTVTPINNIVMVANEMAYAYGKRPLTVFTGVVAPNSQTMQIGATIRNKTSRTFLMQAWISRKTTVQPTMRAYISHMKCVKMQAHIAPRITNMTTMRATILARQQAAATIVFSIQNSLLQAVATAAFNINTGIYSKQGIGIGGYIARMVTKKATIHFTIPASPDTTIVAKNVSFSAAPFSNAQIGIGAYIS